MTAVLISPVFTTRPTNIHHTLHDTINVTATSSFSLPKRKYSCSPSTHTLPIYRYVKFLETFVKTAVSLRKKVRRNQMQYNILVRREDAVMQLVEALRYKPECRGIRFPMASLQFFIDIILPAPLWT